MIRKLIMVLLAVCIIVFGSNAFAMEIPAELPEARETREKVTISDSSTWYYESNYDMIRVGEKSYIQKIEEKGFVFWTPDYYEYAEFILNFDETKFEIVREKNDYVVVYRYIKE